MAYDKDKDVVLKSWDNGDGLQAGIYSYNEGDRKLQLSRYNIKKDGSISFLKLGRLTLDEVLWVQSIMAEVVTILTEQGVDDSEAENMTE